MLDIFGLFPTPLGQVDLDRTLTDSEFHFMTTRPQVANKGNSMSCDNKVLDAPVLCDVRSWIDQQVLDYYRGVWEPMTDARPYVTLSWTNHTEQGQFHHSHWHSNSFISGTFYVDTAASDRIYFYKKHYHQIVVESSNYNSYNSENWWLETPPGRLLLWPSHLEHSVPPRSHVGTRISLSFNVWLEGDIGSDLNLTRLRLTGANTDD